MSRARRAAAVLVLIGLGLPGAPAAGDAVQTWTLDAGTHVALLEDHRVPLVSLQVEFPGGSWSDELRRSHAVEGFRFQLQDPDGELRRRADRLAAGISVAVSGRSAVLRGSCLSEDLDALVDLVRDVLANRDYDRAAIKRAGREARIGWRAALKQPGFRRSRAIALLAYAPDDPRRRRYEKPVAPSSDPARLAAARDRLVASPGRVIGFAGDLTRERAERVAARLLPPVAVETAGFAPASLSPLRSDRPPAVDVTLPRLTQVYLALFRDGPGYRDADYPAWLIADHVLGGHFYSRLYVALRHEGGHSYGARSGGWGALEPGPYALTTYSRLDNAAAAEARLQEALGRFHAEGVTEEERAAAVGYLRGRRAFRRQAPDQILGRFLYERRLGLEPGYLDGLVDRAAALSLEQINTYIREFYRPEAFTRVRVAPAD